MTPEDKTAVFGVETSLSGRRWLWRAGADQPAQSRMGMAIAQRHGVPEIVGRMLALRGVGPDEAACFLEPTLRALMPDPSSLRDMDATASRLADAVCAEETVGIFGDYDVDGACATALMASVLRDLGCVVHTHIPDRMTEGYGPNAPALMALVERGAKLVVCVDCGTAAGDILASLKGHAEVVVIDHHKAEGPPPDIIATVNPNRLDCDSGLNHLCAGGLAFITLAAMLRSLRQRGWFTPERPAPDLMRGLDLVALSTICDVMPLTGLNRAFVTQGLRIMARRERIGIQALLQVAGVENAPTAFSCGYALGPRINAGGRIAEAGLGVKLLLAEDPAEAQVMAERLDAVNRKRQGVEAEILDLAMAQAEAQREAGHATILLSGKDWHAGVVGIVAGRIKERFNRPALVAAALEDGTLKGSGRSVPGLDLGAAVIAARQSGLLLTGGGHAMAAGFSLAEGGIEAFHAFLDERLAAACDRTDAVDLEIDAGLSIAGATVETAHNLGRLAPFGAGNDEPVIVLSHVQVARADRIGRDGSTLRLQLVAEGGARLKALLFRAGDGPIAAALEDRSRPLLHLAGWLRAESWNGRETAGFFIQDAALVR